MNYPEDKQRERYLLPPPRLLSNGEMPPVIEPPLRDMPLFPGGGQVEEWAPFESVPDEQALAPGITRHAIAVVMRDERVMKLLDGKRHIAIGVSRRETRDKPEGRKVSLVAVYYNYDDNLAIEVTLDAEGKTVLSVESDYQQPAPVQSEIDRAIQLATAHEKIAGVTDGLAAGAILIPDPDPTSPTYNHRRFDVRFFCPDERLARHAAIIDLSTEEVVHAGSCGGTRCQGTSGVADETRAL